MQYFHFRIVNNTNPHRIAHIYTVTHTLPAIIIYTHMRAYARARAHTHKHTHTYPKAFMPVYTLYILDDKTAEVPKADEMKIIHYF